MNSQITLNIMLDNIFEFEVALPDEAEYADALTIVQEEGSDALDLRGKIVILYFWLAEISLEESREDEYLARYGVTAAEANEWNQRAAELRQAEAEWRESFDALIHESAFCSDDWMDRFYVEQPEDEYAAFITHPSYLPY